MKILSNPEFHTENISLSWRCSCKVTSSREACQLQDEIVKIGMHATGKLAGYMTSRDEDGHAV